MEKLLTAKQTCDGLGISRATLYKYIRQGRLKAYYFGRTWKFKPSEIEKFLERVQVGK